MYSNIYVWAQNSFENNLFISKLKLNPFLRFFFNKSQYSIAQLFVILDAIVYVSRQPTPRLTLYETEHSLDMESVPHVDP